MTLWKLLIGAAMWLAMIAPAIGGGPRYEPAFPMIEPNVPPQLLAPYGPLMPTYGPQMPYVIKHNGGGIISRFKGHALKLEEQGRGVIVDGTCASACTYYMHNPDFCATPNAEFGFHSPFYLEPEIQQIAPNVYAQTGIHKVLLPDLAREQPLWWPVPVREWVQAHGGLGNDTIWLKGAEMQAVVPQCHF